MAETDCSKIQAIPARLDVFKLAASTSIPVSGALFAVVLAVRASASEFAVSFLIGSSFIFLGVAVFATFGLANSAHTIREGNYGVTGSVGFALVAVYLGLLAGTAAVAVGMGAMLLGEAPKPTAIPAGASLEQTFRDLAREEANAEVSAGTKPLRGAVDVLAKKLDAHLRTHQQAKPLQ